MFCKMLYNIVTHGRMGYLFQYISIGNSSRMWLWKYQNDKLNSYQGQRHLKHGWRMADLCKGAMGYRILRQMVKC